MRTSVGTIGFASTCREHSLLTAGNAGLIRESGGALFCDVIVPALS